MTSPPKDNRNSQEFATEKADALHSEDHVQHAEAMAEAIAVEKPSPWTKPLIKLYCYCVIAFLCSTMNGLSIVLVQEFRAFANRS